MFSGTSAFSPPPGHASPLQQNMMMTMSSIPGSVSPTSSGLGVGLMSTASGGSPIFQSPSSNRFPAQGGPVVFTPQHNASPPGSVTTATPVSPYSYVGGTATSLIRTQPSGYMGVAPLYPLPSTMISNPPQHLYPLPSAMGGHPHHGHHHGSPVQYSNVQTVGYTKTYSTNYAYQSPYQHHPLSPHYYGHHSPREEMQIVEPMHCSPIGQGQPHALGSPQYQQVHRSPHSPPRPQYLPAYFTGIDHIVASVPPRPRRVFERSPSTSPPVAGAGSRSPQSKSANWFQQETQPSSSGYGGQLETANQAGGIFAKRNQGQGPSRQLKFTDTQYFQNLQAAEERDKTKRSGPPVRGFGFGESEEVANFLNSPLLKENNNIVPGAAIAQEAIAKAAVNTPIAESNWITVFGFPAAAASFILTQFSQYGSVVQSKSNPGGNWLHIQYASRIDARRALSCNGKILGGTIMVGVISSPKEVIEAYEKPQTGSAQLKSSATVTPQQSQVKSPLQERNVDVSSPENAKLRIRPLVGSSQIGGAFTSPLLGLDKSTLASPTMSQDPSIARSPQNENRNENVPLPTVSGGMLTKAMEYMFGW